MASEQHGSNGINGHGSAARNASTSSNIDAATSDSMLDQARARALELGQQRALIDAELQSLGETLRAQNATMSSPLLDAEGFPLASIDIVAVRTARARIIRLRNDRNDLETQMQDFVTAALARPTSTSSSSNAVGDDAENSAGAAAAAGQAMAQVPGTRGAMSMSVPTRNEGDASAWASVGGLQPFARVNAVANNSPAMQAGMQMDDEVLQFGELTAGTAHRDAAAQDLGNLPSALQEGTEITVVVLRQTNEALVNGNSDSAHRQASAGSSRPRIIKRLRLTPASGWGGRGLLGCHLFPLP